MSHLARCCVVVVSCSLVLAAPSRGQEAGTPKVETYPLSQRLYWPFRVVATEADGTIRLKPPASSPNSMPGAETTEGHYLLMVPRQGGGALPGRPRGIFDSLLRVEVVEIGEENAVTAKTGPEAAKILIPGEVVSLVRPFRMTTAQIRSLPAVIPIAKEGDGKVPGQVAGSIAQIRQAARLAESVNNLKQIGLALHNFHSTVGNFPPAVVHGPDGKPWHSWRVLILPYLKQIEIYNKYDFTQPWDGPKNRLLIDKMPAVYRDPLKGETKDSNTNYAALVGERTVFSSKAPTIKIVNGTASEDLYKGRGIFEITDGTSNTIAVVPVDPSKKIPWMKPEDIAVGADFPGVGKPGGIFTPAKRDGIGFARVLFADGSVHTLFELTDPVLVRALTTINGGEIIDLSKLDPPNGFHAPGAGQQPTLYLIRDGQKVSAMIE